jgi:glycyl-tRNA synthetase
MSNENENKLDKIVSLCKRRGFVFQGSEIYGGLAGTWDYGPLGVLLQENIKQLWFQKMVNEREDMYPFDSAIIMNPRAWEASGHVAGFADPLADGKMFNVMFKTSVGAGEEATAAYLRPETAGGMFVNFKNILDSLHPSMPFGLGQIGKAFRNEIAPREFLFRQREFKQMEIEYFVRPSKWSEAFEDWRRMMHAYAESIGLPASHIHELEVPDADRAFYSKRTIDFEFDYPFGRRELWGLAYRTDHDLSSHAKFSGVELTYFDEETKEKFVPHVIEPSFGLDRTVLAVLTSAYTEDDLGGDKRVYLKLKPRVAPIKAAVFPLLKNKPELVSKAKEVMGNLRTTVHPWIAWDDNGNIGKRYRRQDEIGTPFCVTIDFDTLSDDTVTIRHRDSGLQDRLAIAELSTFLEEKIK